MAYNEISKDLLFSQDFTKAGKKYPSKRCTIEVVKYDGETDAGVKYDWDAVLVTNYKLTSNRWELEIAKKVRNGRAIDSFSQVRLEKEQLSEVVEELNKMLWN